MKPDALRRWAERSLPVFSVVAALGDLAVGGFRTSKLGVPEAVVVLLLLGATARQIVRRVRRRSSGGEVRTREEVTLGANLLSLAYLVVAVAGSTLFPIIYLFMAFLVGFLPLAAGATLWAIALIFDAVLTVGPEGGNAAAFGAHALFLTLFALLYQVTLAARLALARRAESEAVHKRIREVEEHARTFRLVSSGSRDSTPGEAQTGGLKAQEKWVMASVKEIEGAVGYCLAAAVAAGELPTGFACGEVAGFVVSSLQGANLLAKAQRSLVPVKRFKHVLFSMVLGRARDG